MHQTIDNNRRNLIRWTLISGFILGLAGVLLLRLGNPPNMGLCAACFLRDTTGGLQLFASPAGLQYLRPEIPAFILGSFFAALFFREFRSRGGASPGLRFVLGAFMMIGALVFLGCPYRLLGRLAGGDYRTAGVGLLGMLVGIALGSFFIKRGFSFGPGRDQAKPAALLAPLTAIGFTALIFYLLLSENADPRGLLSTKWQAPVGIAFALALVAGFFIQRSRFCTTGGYRDIMLSGDFRMFGGYIVLLITLVVGNLAIDAFWPGAVKQFAWGAAPIAHEAHLWGFLGMTLVGLAAVLLGGCPLRQMVAAGQGNSDAFITVMGLIVGAAFCHNFGLAAKPASAESIGGPSTAGMIAVVLGLVLLVGVGLFSRDRSVEKNSS